MVVVDGDNVRKAGKTDDAPFRPSRLSRSPFRHFFSSLRKSPDLRVQKSLACCLLEFLPSNFQGASSTIALAFPEINIPISTLFYGLCFRRCFIANYVPRSKEMFRFTFRDMSSVVDGSKTLKIGLFCAVKG